MVSKKRLRALMITILAVTGLAASGHTHVRLITPDGGEQLEGGQSFDIIWEVVVGHQISGWNLWYSITGPNGPWIDIFSNYPPGDSAIGSLHTYRWVVPLENSQNVRVRIKQLTTFGTQWEDTSAANLSILGSCCGGIRGNIDGDKDDQIDIVDLVYLVDAMFKGSDMPSCALEADLDGNGIISDISDLVYLVDYMFTGGPSPTACPQN
jgi:hypothetical protein